MHLTVLYIHVLCVHNLYCAQFDVMCDFAWNGLICHGMKTEAIVYVLCMFGVYVNFKTRAL